jgi:hypothetical protein
VSGEPGASLEIKMLPLTLPVKIGENCTVKAVFAPVLMAAGIVNPLIVKPVPEALAAEMVTLAVPLFIKVIV